MTRPAKSTVTLDETWFKVQVKRNGRWRDADNSVWRTHRAAEGSEIDWISRGRETRIVSFQVGPAVGRITLAPPAPKKERRRR